MAVFFSTGGGDIYAGPTKEDVVAAMQADDDDIDLDEIVEVDGSTKICMSDEDEAATDEFMTLDEAYDEELGAYCIASDNM